MADKPEYTSYCTSIVNEMGFPDFAAAERAYEFNIRSAKQLVMQSQAWRSITQELDNMRSKYSGGRPDLLFYPSELPYEIKLLDKPFESVVGKMFRRNIIYNRNYPKPPREGSIAPNEFYTQIDDLLRTRIVCKYMDGPEFVCKSLSEFCKNNKIEEVHRALNTAAGYYAWHFYFKVDIEISLGGSIVDCSIWVEIQLSTQLAEVITSLTHSLYENRRMNQGRMQEDRWEWKATSPEFKSAYLGHGLHLLEGVIQSFKDDILNSDQPLEEDSNKIAAMGAEE